MVRSSECAIPESRHCTPLLPAVHRLNMNIHFLLRFVEHRGNMKRFHAQGVCGFQPPTYSFTPHTDPVWNSGSSTWGGEAWRRLNVPTFKTRTPQVGFCSRPRGYNCFFFNNCKPMDTRRVQTSIAIETRTGWTVFFAMRSVVLPCWCEPTQHAEYSPEWITAHHHQQK